MKNFWFGSLLFLIIGGCSSPYRNLQPMEKNSRLSDAVSPFQNLPQSLLFKARITRNEDYYSGLMLLKQTDSNTFRVVLTAELGPKIFDFEITPKKFIVHECPKAMNRKIVLNMIERDLRMVLMPSVADNKTPAYSNKEMQHTIYKAKAISGFNYCYVENKSGNLARVENASLIGKKRVQVDFENYRNALPGIINITHTGINLSLQLELAERP